MRLRSKMDENKNKKIRDLTKQEFIELVKEQLSVNQIEVSGIIVGSQKSNLKEIEETVNRLIDKHKDFLLLRKELKLKTGFE